MICPDCVRGLEHCHGTYIMHDDDTVECTELWCVLGLERHNLWVCLPVA